MHAEAATAPLPSLKRRFPSSSSPPPLIGSEHGAPAAKQPRRTTMRIQEEVADIATSGAGDCMALAAGLHGRLQGIASNNGCKLYASIAAALPLVRPRLPLQQPRLGVGCLMRSL